jgi:hypothetical protein
VHGFDPFEEAIAPLRSQALRRHYHALALGNEDGERRLYVQSETTASGFYGNAINRDMRFAPRVYDNRDQRIVPIRKLDSLVAEDVIYSRVLQARHCGARPSDSRDHLVR